MGLRTARLTPIKTLESFDFSFQPSLDRRRIMALAQLEFIKRAEVLHFFGPPGTGKSHLATALGVAAVKAGRSVYRNPLAELIEALSKAEREGRLVEKIRFYARASLPITSGGANLFFQLVNARYEKGAMILTSNRGFAEWGKIFGDPVVATALLDRLLHHAVGHPKSEVPINTPADRRTREVGNFAPALLGKFDPAFTACILQRERSPWRRIDLMKEFHQCDQHSPDAA